MTETGVRETGSEAETPQQRAERVAAGMVRHDQAIRGAGIRLVEIGPGRARVAMRVTEQHVNGHGIGHGGFLFLLADAAFSFACNSHGVSTVAAGADIAFLRAARLGDELEAEAVERAVSGELGPLRRDGAAGLARRRRRGGRRVPGPVPAGPRPARALLTKRRGIARVPFALLPVRRCAPARR